MHRQANIGGEAPTGQKPTKGERRQSRRHPKAIVLKEEAQDYLRLHPKFSKPSFRLPNINLAIDEKHCSPRPSYRKEVIWRYRIKTENAEADQWTSRRVLPSKRSIQDGPPERVKSFHRLLERPLPLLLEDSRFRMGGRRDLWPQRSDKVMETEPASIEKKESFKLNDPELYRHRRRNRKFNRSEAISNVRFISGDHTVELLNSQDRLVPKADAIAGWDREEQQSYF